MGSTPEMNIHKPHAVLIPYPAQGHINPFTMLARLLHHCDFHITFVHTEYNYRRLLRSHGPDSLLDLPSFRFKTIPDGLPPVDADVTQYTPDVCASMDRNGAAPFKALLEDLAAASDNGEVPPVTCVVTDGALPFTLDVTEEMGILNVLFWTASACGFLGYAQYVTLLEKGIIPVNDTCRDNLDKVIECAPQPFEGIRLKDMPSFIRNTEDFIRNYAISLVTRAPRANAIIFNTFEALEGKFLSFMEPNLPPLYPCGPLQLLDDQILEEDEAFSQIKYSLWKYDNQCIDWLNSKEPASVVYVNFGSVTVMTDDQLVEFAWGLANSGKSFLWIIRPDLVSGESAILPQEFVTDTNQRGFLASWCDQKMILKHPSIGGFLTHSGWNSTIESIINGVPMICWPFFAEQQTNSWYSRQLGMAVEIDNNVKRKNIAEQVKELMNGEKGMEMKRKAKEWKELAYEAVSPMGRGENRSNLDRLIKEVLLSKRIAS